MADTVWRLRNTRAWSKKRDIEKLHGITADYYKPMHWRRLLSRPGWFIAFVRYEPRQ